MAWRERPNVCFVEPWRDFRPHYLTCKRGSDGQSEGLFFTSSVRFRLKPENSNPHGLELHSPSIKGTKLLLKVIKAIIIIITAEFLTDPLRLFFLAVPQVMSPSLVTLACPPCPFATLAGAISSPPALHSVMRHGMSPGSLTPAAAPTWMSSCASSASDIQVSPSNPFRHCHCHFRATQAHSIAAPLLLAADPIAMMSHPSHSQMWLACWQGPDCPRQAVPPLKACLMH